MIAFRKFSRRLLLVPLVSWFSSSAAAAAPDAGLVKEGAEWKIPNLISWFDAPAKADAPAGASTQNLAAAKGKIVVSGFEAFAGRSINASSEIAQAIVKEFPELDITFVQVPVVWGAPKQAIDRARSRNPVIWIAFGEGTNIFQVETVANNARGEFRDNRKELPAAKQIDPKGARQLKLDFPAGLLSKRLRDLGYDCKTSSDAKDYLCEETLYSLLAAKNSPETELKHALFIHVPIFGSNVRVRGKEVPLSGDNLRRAARDLFEAIAAVMKVPAPG